MSKQNKLIVLFMLGQAFLNYKYAYGFTCGLLVITVALILCQQFIYSPWAIKHAIGFDQYKKYAENEIASLKYQLAEQTKKAVDHKETTKKSFGQLTPAEYQAARDEWVADQKKPKNVNNGK